jgi:hypothetical protein
VYPSAALFQKPTSEIDLAAARSLGIDSGGRKELVGAAWA